MKGIWHLSTDTAVANFMTLVSDMRLAGKPVRVKLLPEKRSLDQNALMWKLYGQIAAQAGDQTTNEVHRQCKLDYGVGILRAADDVFNGFCAKCLDELTYEQQLKAMAYVDVTRLMDTPQASEYIDTIIREYSKQGYALAHPSEAA